MEHPYLIIGGGIAGLTVAQLLTQRQIGFLGLEHTSELGGRAGLGHHRLYQEESLKAIKALVNELEWTTVEDSPMERHKGEWRNLTQSYTDLELFYLQTPFFVPNKSFENILSEVREEVKEKFKTNQTVVQILPKSKKVICQDGSEYAYEKIVWCSPTEALAKAWKGEKKNLSKLFKNTEADNSGINLELQLSLDENAFRQAIPSKNTTSFSFRFKDKILRALGTPDFSNPDSTSIHWLVFLPKEVFEAREEVAKCVRTLKRELFKEFPVLKDNLIQDKIIYLPNISGDPQVRVKSTEILPDVYYVGSQIRTAEGDSSLHNIDCILENFQAFEKTLEA